MIPTGFTQPHSWVLIAWIGVPGLFFREYLAEGVFK